MTLQACDIPATQETPEEVAFKAERAAVISAQLATLTPREEIVIKMRFGLGCPARTLREVGERFGVTPERIRQVEIRALRKLRYPPRSAALKPFTEWYVTPGLKPLAPALRPTEKGWEMVGAPRRVWGMACSRFISIRTYWRAVQAMRNRRIRDMAPSRAASPFDYLFANM